MAAAVEILVRGRRYVVSVLQTLADGPQYMLTGARGAAYGTMRNIHRPSRLFLIDTRGYSGRMNGVWLTDEDGTLRVVAS